MIVNKAEINQELKIDAETIDKLQHVKGNVYIIQSNTGSIESKINSLDLKDCLLEHYKRGVSFKELIDQVKRIYIELALRDSQNISEAARRLQMNRRKLDYYFSENKQISLENDNQ